MAAGIDDLALPSLTVPDLFRPHKIVTPGPIGYGPFQGMTLGSPPQSLSGRANSPTSAPAVLPGSGKGMDPQRVTKAGDTTISSARRPSLHSSYSSVLQSAVVVEDRASTPELNSGDGSVFSDPSDSNGPPSVDSRSSSPVTRMKRINPRIVELTLSH